MDDEEMDLDSMPDSDDIMLDDTEPDEDLESNSTLTHQLDDPLTSEDRYRLERQRLRNERYVAKMKYKIAKAKPSEIKKIMTGLSLTGVILKFMSDHHTDKLTEDQQKLIEKELTKAGYSSAAAKKISTMNKQQLKKTFTGTISKVVGKL